MAIVKRLDSVEVAAASVQEALAAYRRNFGLATHAAAGADEGWVVLGGARVKIVAAPQPQDEGMVGLWLEAEDVEAAARAISAAGYRVLPMREVEDRRVVEVDKEATGGAPLFLFDRLLSGRSRVKR